MNLVAHEFRSEFRAALMDLQGFHTFLLTLHQKLDSLLKGFMNIIDKTSSKDFDREDLMGLMLGLPVELMVVGGVEREVGSTGGREWRKWWLGGGMMVVEEVEWKMKKRLNGYKGNKRVKGMIL
ncbi:hypothetical protein Tco_0422483 [Tanacetum coccineum]